MFCVGVFKISLTVNIPSCLRNEGKLYRRCDSNKSLTHLLAAFLLALGDGHLEPHVVALLLAVLGVRLLPAHGEGELELQLLLTLGLGPAMVRDEMTSGETRQMGKTLHARK